MISVKRLPLLALATLLLHPSEMRAQTSMEWSWFRATTAANDWWITKGRADVAITGSSFTATLWDGNTQNFARASLKGTIRHNLVRVTVTVNNTDMDPFRLSGALKRVCWDGGGGREEVMLTSGGEVIGLFRDIYSGSCVPIN